MIPSRKLKNEREISLFLKCLKAAGIENPQNERETMVLAMKEEAKEEPPVVKSKIFPRKACGFQEKCLKTLNYPPG